MKTIVGLRVLRICCACAGMVCALCFGLIAAAQSRTSALYQAKDPRGPAELVICSQNLENLGSYADTKAKNPALTLEQFQYKEETLVKRFALAGCDVIAVHELLGRNDAAGEKVLELLAAYLKNHTNRYFAWRVAPSNDPMLRSGFLVAKDRAEIVTYQSYLNVELPKLTEEQKPRLFLRGPLEVQLQVKGKEGSGPKMVSLVTFHLKSKAGGLDDPAGLEFETLRMEMAEGLRRVIETRHKQSFASGETVLVVLGDRNAEFNSASARILEGVLTLKQFQGEGGCRLSKNGVPLCQAGAALPQKLFSVLTTDPQVRLLPGSYTYKKAGSWIDDILMPAESLRYAQADAYVEGDYASGVVYKYREASDHALIWTTLNW